MSNNIQESELIINSDGSIYHLQLTPDEIADLIITVGDPDRVEMVSKYFDSIEVKKAHREFVTHTGFIGKKRLSVISTGIGTDNIDIVMNELDALVNIDFESRLPKAENKSLKIVRVGTSGSLRKEIPVDAFVASAAGLGLDSLMHYYKIDDSSKLDNLDLTLPFLPYYFEAGSELLNLFPDFTKGITATCPGFYAPQGRSLRLEAVDKNLLDKLRNIKINGVQVSNFEMETAGIYGLSQLMGHQALSLNAILANRETGVFSSKATETVDKLIQKALEVLV